MRSSDIFFVRVVTSTRSPRPTVWSICSIKSSICPRRLHNHLVNQPCWSNYLLDNLVTDLISYSPGVADKNHLVETFHYFFKSQRPVVARRWQAEAMFNQRVLSRSISAIAREVEERHGFRQPPADNRREKVQKAIRRFVEVRHRDASNNFSIPVQYPTSCSISRSYSVLMRSLCASEVLFDSKMRAVAAVQPRYQ